jgi:hypothetical protein
VTRKLIEMIKSFIRFSLVSWPLRGNTALVVCVQKSAGAFHMRQSRHVCVCECPEQLRAVPVSHNDSEWTIVPAGQAAGQACRDPRAKLGSLWVGCNESGSHGTHGICSAKDTAGDSCRRLRDLTATGIFEGNRPRANRRYCHLSKIPSRAKAKLPLPKATMTLHARCNRKRATDFNRFIFWALKRAVCVEADQFTFTWKTCTWSRPWCPQTRRAWPVHQGGGDEQPSGSPGR